MPATQGHDESPSPVSVDYTKLSFLAAGQSGVVYGIDEDRILKQYYDVDSDDVRVEREALRRLGQHPNIVSYLGAAADGCAVLERGTPIRTLCRPLEAKTRPPWQTFRWLKDAALGLQHVHRSGILHADVGCHNMILVRDRLKLIDFQGCSIDGQESISCYEWFSYRRTEPAVTVQTDIFAYGCAAYEIVTGRHPYWELASKENRMPRALVEERYAQGQYPDVAHLPFGATIHACWTGSLDSMDAVLSALEADYASWPKKGVGDDESSRSCA